MKFGNFTPWKCFQPLKFGNGKPPEGFHTLPLGNFMPWKPFQGLPLENFTPWKCFHALPFRNFASEAAYRPLKSTPSNSSEGMRQLDERRGSLPTSARLLQSVTRLPVTFISETGCASLPPSMRKPSTP